MKTKCNSLFLFLHAERFFYVPYTVLIISVGFFSIITEKTELHLFVNQFVGKADGFFSMITILGDGLTACIFVFLLLLLDINIAIRSLYAFLLSTIIVWICKFIIFTDVHRPKVVFEQLHIAINLVPGIEVYGSNSFPSGHATSIFAIFTCLACTSKHQVAKLVLLLIAVVTAFSRVYLSQHFLEDALVGSLIGVLSAIFIFHLLRSTCFAWNKKKLIIGLRTT